MTYICFKEIAMNYGKCKYVSAGEYNFVLFAKFAQSQIKRTQVYSVDFRGFQLISSLRQEP